MRLKILHHTEYSYDAPVRYALQRVRLFPRSDALQTVHGWEARIEGAGEQVAFTDQFGNETRLYAMDRGASRLSVAVTGEIETVDTNGISGAHRGFAPLWLFQQQTPLTTPGSLLLDFAEGLGEGNDLDRMHDLMGRVRARIAYIVNSTDPATTAEESLALGKGVCQDHAHVFLSVARHLGFPARYVSGYLRIDGVDDQTATHAWAEAYLPTLGWVGFDCSNGIAPDERYARIATGRDYRDAMPISGIRHGAGEENLAVHITVEQ